MWVQMSDAELVQRSDLIVQGTWLGQSEVAFSPGPGRLNLGVVAITEVLKGPSASTLVLIVVPGSDAPRSSTDIVYRKGDQGLWLLRARPGGNSGLYLADHPQRFVPSSAGSARIKEIQKAAQQP